MKLLIALLLATTLCFGCGNTTRISAGIPTQLKSIAHTSQGDTYTMATISERMAPLSNWGINISSNTYKVDDEHFGAVAVGVKYFPITWGKKWFLFEVGAGLRLTEVDDRNPWLANSHLLTDLSCGVGVKWKDFSVLYSLQHLSAPFRDDRGLNFDMLIFEWRF